MDFESMNYVVKVTRELGVGIPRIILDTSGEHKDSEYCPQTDELIYTKLGADGYFQLAHELRHKWQWVNHQEEYFANYQELDTIDLNAYGKQIAEVDANAFAAIMAMKYLDSILSFPKRLRKEKRKIYDRAKILSKEYGVNREDWKTIYKSMGI